MNIPFNKFSLTGKELEYMQESIKNGTISGNAQYSCKCEDLLEKTFNAKRVLLTNSCTGALEMASLLIHLGPDDEVIVPSYTFVSTVNAFILRGAKPVFVDIRKDTLNIDETKIEEKITPRTKAIFPVHYASVACEMDKIMNIAKRYNLFVVEDAAQGVNAKYDRQYLGTIGDFGTYSFHGSKNYTCGEGGAIVINNDDFVERAEIIREKGTNKHKFLRGEIDKYTWVDIGSSYLLSDLLAAFLYAQLENMKKIDERRKKIYNLYFQELTALADNGILQLPIIPTNCQPNYHLFYIILKNEKIRDDLLHYLNFKGIGATWHFIPLHLSPVGCSMGYTEGQLPVTESISCRLLRLPLYYKLKKDEQLKVIESIRHFFDRNSKR